jgi:hypothetical protein
MCKEFLSDIQEGTTVLNPKFLNALLLEEGANFLLVDARAPEFTQWCGTEHGSS